MKAISAHVTGFYRASFHAYTTEVSVDGHRWRLGLRYSKFHEFYDQLVAAEKDFHAEFPPKGSLFFTPKPEERQEQLETFLQQVLAFYAAKCRSAEMEDLLCDLLKVPRHLKSPEHEDDDVSTSTESVLDEPMHEPPSSSNSVASVGEKVAPKEEEKVVAAPEPVQPASPVAEDSRPVEKMEAHDKAETEVETPVGEAETRKEAVEEGVAAVEEEAAQEEEAAPVAAQVPAEEPATETKCEQAVEEEAVAAELAAEADDDEARAEASEAASPEEKPVIEPISQEEASAPAEPQAAEEPAASESKSPKEDVEQKELATSGFVASWIAAYLPKSLLGFIRRRCMKKTNLVVLCVALLLPLVLARR
ncbi:hypothetical protein PHYPSEUDO_013450 [Phytophthora pseudosyringae]|uniref:PX domain-containing protein n=1 Tax=Phytophthora pseudosyringae TaxID=221518 RepID=A0A8T1WFL3_9STRA|nr:hypothetical protein PHYPSEUDO_013450 [Phytophthora pseudosyringae]